MLKVHYLLIGSALLLFAGCAQQESAPTEDDAFLIISAVRSGEGAQPTWIALRSGDITRHVPAAGALSPIKPGSYSLVHVDFQKSKMHLPASGSTSLHDLNRRGSTYPKGTVEWADSYFRYQFEAGNIYYIGKVVVGQRNSLIAHDADLLQRACAANRGIFTATPLYITQSATPEQPFRLDCDGLKLLPLGEPDNSARRPALK